MKMRQPGLLPAGDGLRLGTPASLRLPISGCGRVGQGRGMSVSRREVRPLPLRAPWLLWSHARTSRRQPVGPAGLLARGGVGQGDSWLAGWRAVGGGVHARQRFPVQRFSCACGWSARGGAERSRRGGAPAGRGPEPGRAGAGMPLFFSALLALLLVALSALFLGR